MRNRLKFAVKFYGVGRRRKTLSSGLYRIYSYVGITRFLDFVHRPEF
jgi:hypothetical protein